MEVEGQCQRDEIESQTFAVIEDLRSRSIYLCKFYTFCTTSRYHNYSKYVNSSEIDPHKQNKTLVRRKRITTFQPSYLTLLSVLEPKTCANIEKNSYAHRLQFNRKICRSIFKIPRFMQNRNFFTNQRLILTVFKHNYLKIRATHETQYTFRMFCYEERPFNRKEKVSSFILPEILVKNTGINKITL